ncbi:DUF2341 domain-containing protein [Nitrospira sp. MA-1]|nr:DUF2341 domain-containing protein [Nitrospira sp. MA-1]
MKTLLALEPRILFDGAALSTGAEVVQDTTTQDQTTPDTDADADKSSGANITTENEALWASGLSLATPPDRREIVFIDTRVEDYQTLIKGIDPAAEVILLESTHDGVEQIAAVLAGRTDVEAIHLIGEGTEAELHLGTAFLTTDSIHGKYAELFSQIGQSLSADADLLIYGCNFGRGESGLSAIQTLADLTGADIAASIDRTGHVSEYANWELEVSTGFIETSIVIDQATQDAWEGVLATYTVTTTTDGGAGSLRQAIINANANAGTDTITFVGSGTYLLTITGTGENAAATGDLDITESLNIIGNGAGSTIIDASGLGGTPDRVFDIRTGITTMSGVTIKGGSGVTGAGIETQSGTTLDLIDVELRENFSAGNGGGIFNSATLTLDRVTIANNTASGNGGGIYFSGGVGGTLTNVTISSNSAANGGGLYNSNTTVTILNSTIADNSTGIAQLGGAAITQLKNSILDNVGANANTPLTSMGFNIDSDGTAGIGGPIDPRLAGLADNGGPTRTHALLAGSPAINAGTATGAPTVDQRGATRDASVDIGGFEAGSNAPPVINNQVFPVAENSANSTSVGTVVGTDGDPQSGYSKLYWVDPATDEVRRINLDGSGSQQLAMQFDGMNGTGPRGVTIDDVNGKVYWTNNTTNSLWRADLDGGNPEQLLTGLNNPLGITVDPTGGKIYWVDTAGTAIWHANLDGSSSASLITGITDSKDLTVDSTGGKLYWTDKGIGTIKRANLNGSTIETIVSGLNDPWGIALDVTAGKVYWSEATLNEIQRADMMVGATAQTVVTGANQPRDLTLELVQGKIYWSAATTDRIESASLGGSPLPPVTATGDWPSGLAIGPAVRNLTFSIIGGNTGGAFAINAVSGEITVVNSAALDYETNPSFGLTVQVTDNLGLSDTATITINIGAVNEGPAFSGLDNTPTFTEGGAAVVLDNNATIADPELDTANDYSGASLTLVRNGGANGEDVFAGSGTLSTLTESGSLVVGGTTIGTVTTNSGGTLVFTFNGNATTARVNSALQQITYANSSGTPPANVQIDFTINDGNAGAQGSGGALSDTGSIMVTIDPNTTPTATADNYTVDEDTSLTTEPAWFNEAWLSRQKLTFNNPAQAENFTDFPVLITLDAGNIDYTKVQNAGEDLRYVDPDGTELAYEIESWNESGTSYVWVKVPQIDASSGTDYIWMYYDNAGATDNQNAAGVWSNNFEALSHLHDDFTDSTGNAHNGSNNGSLDINGTIGDGQFFDGVNDRIDIPSSAGIDNIFTGGATVSAWINPSAWGEGGYGRILDKGDAAIVTNGWALQLENTGSRLIFELGFSGTEGRWRSSDNAISLDTWQLVTVVFDSSSATNDPTIYVNGVALGITESDTPSGTANSDAGLDLAIGNRSGSTDRTFQGILDETRLETTIRSADWIKAQYLSMTGAFVTFGTGEGPGGVLANDTDADGDPLTAIQVSADPANAQSFSFNADGSFSYTPVANFTGTDTFTYKVNDGTDDGNTVVVTINVNPVNDSPTVATNTGATVNEASSGNIITTAMLNEGDPDDAGIGLTYTVTAVTTNGTLRLSGTPLGVNDTFTQDDIDSNRVTYDHNGSETTTDSFNFSLADGGENGSTPATGVFTITISPANDQPLFSGLDNTPTFTEGGAAVVLDNNATIADPELDAANDYNGATLTLVRNGGANSEDVFANTGTLNALTESGSLVVGGTTIGTVTTNSGGTLSLTFNGNATTARVNSTLQQITFANSSSAPPATVQIDFTINDGNAGSQGSGGALYDTGSIIVTINPINDPPIIDLDANDGSGATGNDYAATFSEGAGPIGIADSDTDVVDPDSTTFTYVKLAVSGLLDGNAETLVLDGDTFTLASAVAGQNTTGGNYHVVLATGAGTATLTITKQGGGTFSEAETETLIKTVQYQHTDTATPTDGNRLIDVIVNDGTADSAASRTSINVNPGNDPPTATIIASSFGVNEDDTYRPIAGVSVSDIDAGTNDLSVTLSVNNGLLRLVTTTGLTFVSSTNDSATMTVTGTMTNLNNALATLRYQPDPDFAGTDLLTLMVDDLGNTGGGSLTAMDTATIVVAPINDPPSFNGLNQTPTFIQGGGAVVLDNNATITDPELDAANNYNGATLTLVRNGGANAEDLFNGSGTLLPLVESGNLMVGATTIGTVTTNSGGTLVLTFNSNATTALVNSALQQLTYANSSGTPPASVQIDFTIDDGNAGGQGSGGALNDTGSITVTINGTNIPPVAVADAFTVTQGSTAILNLAGNDLDADDGLDLTSITIVTGPTNGTIDSINTDGTVTYNHNGSATVTDSFTYTIDDLAAATSNTVTVSLTVNLLNVPPVALADSFTVNEGTTTTLNLAMNDIDLDDGLDPASITIVAGPTNGTIASINANGTVTYAHNGSETLADSFTYTINDLSGATSNTVTVSLTVTPVNDAPVAVADSFIVSESSTTILNLAGNDTDADDGLDLTSITIVSGPANGTITSINADGTVDYTHNGSETLADSFSYTIRDQSGATSNTVTVNLTVTPVNDVPIITSNGGGASANISVITGNTPVTNVDASDAEGATLTYSIIGGADAALFRIDPTTGVLTFITAPDFQAPGDAGRDNIYDVTVQASDGTAVDTQAIAVTVTQANVPPQIFIPPPPDSPPSPDPPPRDAGEETSGDQAPGNWGSFDPGSPGNIPDHGQGSTATGIRDSNTGNPLAQDDGRAKQPDEERTRIVDEMSDIMGSFHRPLDLTTLKNEIRSLLHRSGFLQDLDSVRDGIQDVAASEKTYLASSIAVSTGMSIGYVIWLLRSGVLLTALLSSVPAWQFVNPLLVLDSATKKKRQKGQKAVKNDSVESLFEKSMASTGIVGEKTGDPAKTARARWFNWNKR